MDVKLAPGKYVIAVSGGVDSMVLLHLLAKRPELELVVAHADHGMRPKSASDAKFVEQAAKKYDLEFEKAELKLGKNASEAAAREARYDFLKKTKTKHTARAIITAHHQDDAIETALINQLRGSGTRGIIALKDTPALKRPLLGVSKAEILNYARQKSVDWREDSSNVDDKYLRNRLRKALNGLTQAQRTTLTKNMEKVAKNRKQQDIIIATLSRYIENNARIKRSAFNQLNTLAAAEVLHSKYRYLGEIDKQTIERMNLTIRTAKPGARVNIIGSRYLVVDKHYAWVE